MNKSEEYNKILEYIKKNQLEKILPKSCMHILKIRHFETDEIIVRSGSPVNYLYLLLEGKARISPTSEEGKMGLLDFVMQNDVIGDLEYFAKDLYYYDVTALRPSTVLAIPTIYIEEAFNDNVSFYKFICENMSAKMKRTSLKYSNMLLYPVKDQVANYLYNIYLNTEKTTLPIVFKEIAEFFDITPRYLRTVLTELEDEEIISRQSNGIKILDLNKLKNYKI